MKNQFIRQISKFLCASICLCAFGISVIAQRGGQSAYSEENILSGAVEVNVRSIADRTIRLGLAPGGVTMVEFPAADFIFARHPGDENFVTIDESLKERANPSDPLVFRPGKGFFVPQTRRGRTPYGQIIVQMVSGAVFTFQIYPVKNLDSSTTRVQILYSPDEIVAERTRLGLPVYLNMPREMPQPPARIEKSSLTATTASADALPSKDGKEITPQQRIEELGQKMVAGASSYNWNFGAPVHGLAVAAQPSLILENGGYRMDLIAVKNTLSEAVSLVNLPSMVIETYEPKNRKIKNALNQERCPMDYIFHDLPDSAMLLSGTTYYFAIVAKYPVILGVNQELKIAVAQTNAADEPVFLNLITKAR